MHLSWHIKSAVVFLLIQYNSHAADVATSEAAAGYFPFQPSPHLVLAQTLPTVDATDFYKWLVNLTLLCLLVYIVRRTFPPRTPPLEESFEKIGASEKLRSEMLQADLKNNAYINDRFKGLSDKIESTKRELNANISALRDENNERGKHVQENYEDIIGAIGEIKGEMKSLRRIPNA